MSIWICEIGHEFGFIRKGVETRPKECPVCKSKKLDVREV